MTDHSEMWANIRKALKDANPVDVELAKIIALEPDLWSLELRSIILGHNK